MKKIFFFLLLMIVLSCKKETNATPQREQTIAVNDAIIYSSNNIKPHLKFNTEFGEYKLIALTNPQLFNLEELTFPVQENEFEFNKTAELKYYTTTTFNFNTVAYKVIAYPSYGENDSKVVNIQLNSYKKGKQIDALLLDCRFTDEITYYREFTIKKDGTITIKKLTIEGLTYNDKGDITGEKTVKDTTASVVRYKMNSTAVFIKF